MLFKRRWTHKLVTKRGQKFAMDWSNALTCSNVRKMYDEVYDCMVDAGVARCFDQPSSLNPKRLKSQYRLTDPEICLVVDEVGSNISQQGDSHFTVLGFPSLDGFSVLCVIIITGVKQMY